MANQVINQWPTYESSFDALSAATSEWGERLQNAQHRYRLLNGSLPNKVGALAISVIDGNTEMPESFSLLDIYNRHQLDSGLGGAPTV